MLLGCHMQSSLDQRITTAEAHTTRRPWNKAGEIRVWQSPPKLNWLGPATPGVTTPITPADFCFDKKMDFQPPSLWESVLQIQTQVPYSYMDSL